MAENLVAQADYRNRRLFLLMYADDESDIMLTLTERSNCWFHYAFIKHDKDVFDNGEAIEPHWHMILQLSTNYSAFEVCDWFKKNTRQNCFAELVLDPKKCYEYLTHDTENSKVKYRYSKDDIRSDDFQYFIGQFAKTEQMVYDIMFGAPLDYMVRTYGREYVINRDRYHEFAQEMWDKLPYEKKRRAVEKNYFAQQRVDVFNRMLDNDPHHLAQ